MEEQTGKDRINNKVVELLEQKQLGWISSYISTTGRKFVDLFTEVLWYIDGCHKTLEGLGFLFHTLSVKSVDITSPKSTVTNEYLWKL